MTAVADEITEVTRRAIIDFLVASGTPWAGRLPEEDFLARLYDLSKMPSTDSRRSTAAGDINQHRTNWHDDWPDDWVFHDARFNLLHAPDAELLRFLCETAHPVVRPDSAEARALVETYNQELAADGWRLVEIKQLSGKPVFGAMRIGDRAEVFPEQPTGWPKVDRQRQEVKLRLDTAASQETFQAIGLLCRELLITVAQEMFDPSRHPVSDGVAPSPTDAARMLDAVFSVELQGGANEEARAHAKAVLKLALALQHKRTADFKMAALSAEAAFSVVNICAVLAGRR